MLRTDCTLDRRLDRWVPIQCGKCGGVIPASLVCTKCGIQLKSQDGVVVLDSPCEDAPAPVVEELLGCEETETAFRRVLHSRDDTVDLGHRLLSRSGAAWRFLLPIDPDSIVLCIEPSTVSVPLGLAALARHVLVLSSSLLELRWLQKRAKRDGVDNLRFVCGTSENGTLPFRKAAFNYVVADSLSVATESMNTLYAELNRVVDSDGGCFLICPNRYAWRQWKSGRLNQQACSLKEYHGALLDAGFRCIRAYVPCPNQALPNQMVDFTHKTSLQNAHQRNEPTLHGRLRQKVKGVLSAMFPEAFAIVATAKKKPTYLDQVFLHINAATPAGSSSGHEQFTYRMNAEMGIVTVITHGSRDPLILKLPIHDRGLQELQAETAILNQVSEPEHPLHSQSKLFARVRAGGKFGQQNYFAYSMLPGVSGDKISATSDLFGTGVKNVADFLANLHTGSPDQQTSLEQLVQPIRQAVLSLASNPQQIDITNRVADKVLKELSDSYQGAVWSHGDSKVANFMFDEKSADLTGVIDWGTGFQPELPGYDLSFLFISSEATRTRTSLPDQLRKQFTGGLPQHLHGSLDAFLKTTGLSLNDSHYKSIVAYQWLKRLAPLADEYETMRFDHRYLDTMFDAVSL